MIPNTRNRTVVFGCFALLISGVAIIVFVDYTAERMETTFQRTVQSRLTADRLWKQVRNAFRDSSDHPFWPQEFEHIEGEELQEGGRIQVTYHTPTGDQTVTYDLVEYDPDRKRFQYRATDDHPLDGGGTLKINALSETDESPSGNESYRSELVWTGSYRHRWYSLSALYLKWYFLDAFFGAMEENLRAYEQKDHTKRKDN